MGQAKVAEDLYGRSGHSGPEESGGTPVQFSLATRPRDWQKLKRSYGCIQNVNHAGSRKPLTSSPGPQIEGFKAQVHPQLTRIKTSNREYA